MPENIKIITPNSNGEKVSIDVLLIPDFEGGLAGCEDIIKRIFPPKYTTDFTFDEQYLSACNGQIKKEFINVLRTYLSALADKNTIYPDSVSNGYTVSFFSKPDTLIKNISFKNILVITPYSQSNMFNITVEALKIAQELNQESLAVLVGFYQNESDEENTKLIVEGSEKVCSINTYLIDRT